MESWVPNVLMGLPAGIAGTRRTLDIMRSLARQGSVNLAVRQRALTLTGALQQKDFVGELKALFLFVRDSIRYVRDPLDVETVQSADYTLSRAAGDCDDKSVLLAAMCLSIGHPARFVAVGFTAPDELQHVFVEAQAQPGGAWYAMDATEPRPFGWSPLQERMPSKVIVTEV